MDIVIAHSQLLLLIACLAGFFMAWGIGANDVANAMGTSVGSKALTITQAIVVAAIFETAGAILAGGQVTNTIRSGIIDPTHFSNHPQLLIYGMLAALLAAGTWLLIASYFAWPVSTTHSIVGAILGFGLLNLEPESLHWHVVMAIAGSWVITPVLAGVLAYVVFISIRHWIFLAPMPMRNACLYLPFYIFLVVFVIAMITLLKGLKPLHLHMDLSDSIGSAVLVSALCAAVSAKRIYKIYQKYKNNSEHIYKPSQYHGSAVNAPQESQNSAQIEQGVQRLDLVSIEKVFGILTVFTACAMAFAHGSNDVANAIGPLAAIVSILSSGGQVTTSAALPLWILCLGAMGIVTGLAMYGHKVIATVGEKITELSLSRAFAASFATATTVVLASGLGLPVSTTQTLVGAVLGVGLVSGVAALNLRVIFAIVVSWLVTLPAGAVFAILFFKAFQWLFSL